MKAASPPSCEKAMTELATEPPLTRRGSRSLKRCKRSRCSPSSTRRMVPRSKPRAANSASDSSRKMSTMALPRPQIWNGFIHHLGTECCASLCNFEQYLRVFRSNDEQRAGSAGGCATALLPVLQRPHRYAKQFGKTGLRQPRFFPYRRDVRDVDHPTVLAAL